MGIRDFFDSRFFEHHWKNKVFIAQVALITLAFILGIAKSIKSYVFLAYEHFTQKVDRFKRFGSLKTNAILNTIDVVFWMVVMGLAFSMVTKVCIGANCAVGVLVGLVSLLVALVNFWAAVIAWKVHRHFKSTAV
ncbi:hypothetical protein KAF25_005944 [Fusarium avenaceum]|uniref:Uncharacterized protein n=1 Tax=Fusarium avenaceum TaxID=40199 RepID=A0A9P7GXS9_9HYPO|nr:hypothetical protein KAF25_005944 [Fusarium avenaceum]